MKDVSYSNDRLRLLAEVRETRVSLPPKIVREYRLRLWAVVCAPSPAVLFALKANRVREIEGGHSRFELGDGYYLDVEFVQEADGWIARILDLHDPIEGVLHESVEARRGIPAE